MQITKKQSLNPKSSSQVRIHRGVIMIFQRGEGGHTVSTRGYSPDLCSGSSRYIRLQNSRFCHLNIVGYFLTKNGLQRGGGGVGVTDTPGAP